MKKNIIAAVLLTVGLISIAPAAQAADCVPSEAVPAVPASIAEGWYTEQDDNAPVAGDTGLVFTADGVKATGLRTSTSYSFAEASGQSYSAYFHDRLVIDPVGEPYGAGNWRNDYSSITFIDGGVYVNVPGSGWQSITLDEAKALFPDAVVTSRGYHMDSNAPAGTTATIQEAWVAPVAEIPAVTCPVVEEPVTEEPVVEQPVAEQPAPAAPAPQTEVPMELAATGMDDFNPFILLAGGLLVAGGIVTWVVGRRRAARD